ncbi:MAG: hypothetical protein WCF90_04285 [Methanomicrobiales archaeon]
MDPQALTFIDSLDADTRAIFAQHNERNIILNTYVIHEFDPLFVLVSALPAMDVPGLEDDTLVVR